MLPMLQNSQPTVKVVSRHLAAGSSFARPLSSSSLTSNVTPLSPKEGVLPVAYSGSTGGVPVSVVQPISFELSSSAQLMAAGTRPVSTLVAPSVVLKPPPPAPVVPATLASTYIVPEPSHTITGVASWYGAPYGTCASPWIAFGTRLNLVNLNTGAQTSCVVADRGPYEGGRILDLSEGTFSNIASPGSGLIEVRASW